MSWQAASQVTVLLLAVVACQSSRPPSKAEESNPVKETRLMTGRRYVKPSDEELRTRLSPLEYAVTQRGATEPPFQNRYFDWHEEGLYVDVVSGEPLFSSRDKFDSGTGWPSFSAPVAPASVHQLEDRSQGMRRVEVRSSAANSHLGHVFEDGPKPTGLRYCINSAALRFIPKDRLQEEGYGEYQRLIATASFTQATASANVCNSRVGPAGCAATLEIAYLAGGCFWGMQDILRKVPGVIETQVGYLGGTTQAPTYDDVRTGTTGHAETVRVTFDPQQLSFSRLLEDWFFRMHDPTTVNQQGNDRGSQYRSAVFYVSESQRETSLAVIQRVQRAGRFQGAIVTELKPAGAFTKAEEAHQDYLVKHPSGYTCHFLRK